MMNIKPTLCERLFRAASLAVLLGGLAACAAAPRERPLSTAPIQGGPGTLEEARKFLEGRWALESFEVHPPGKAADFPKGSGVLNYDDFGNLRMDIRADEASSRFCFGPRGLPSPSGVVSTEGRTVIDSPNRTLTYFLEGQPSSMATGGGPLATSRPRHWEVTGDVLTLTTHDEAVHRWSFSRWKRTQ